MTKCFRIKSGKVAIWEKPLTGDKFAPFDSPGAHLDAVYFHSDFDYYVRAASSSVAITHAAFAADPGHDPYTGGLVVSYNTQTETDRLLLTHGLPYVPRFAVTVDGQQIPHGFPIQTNSSGGRRCVVAYATTTEIRLLEATMQGQGTLSSIGKVYDTTAFRAPGNLTGAPLAQLKPARVRMGFDRIDSDAISLREPMLGEASQLFLPAGETFGIANGQIKFVLPDGTVAVTGPTGGPYAYNGRFYGSASKKVVFG
jgi:hypothetical protein